MGSWAGRAKGAGILAGVLGAAASPAWAGVPTERFSLLFDTGAAWVRYEETGRREFEGLSTEWADVALLVTEEARYRFPVGLVPLLRFSFLTSAEDTETNNQGSSTTEMHIQYFFSLQPGVQYEIRPHPSMVLAPEFSWDFDWYRQVRESDAFGEIDEDVFWQGPAAGFELFYAVCERFGFDLAYRHSFLIDVEASNSFAESLGFGDFPTDGDRDLVQLRALVDVHPHWSVIVGYRFEAARIDASDTRERTIAGPTGPQVVRVQFPENEHTIHAATIGVRASF